MQPKLRRIALHAQGLAGSAGFGRGRGAVARAIAHLGYVQIDTISVVERAHHHVLRTRVENYEPTMLNALVARHEIYEYWYHAAAFLPMQDYRYNLRRMQTYRDGTARWMRSHDRKLQKEVLARVRADGPLRSRDFEDPNSKAAGWWNWKPAKRALEQLFMEGELVVVAREGFQKTYDLRERAIPDHVDTSLPTELEQAEYLVATTLRAHGFAHLKSFTHLRRGEAIRRDVAEALRRRVAAGTVIEFKTCDGQRWFADAERLEQRAPQVSAKRVHILSPFDNAVILRDRVEAVFGFSYNIECYVPEAKRQYGYFTLPILVGDRFAGRVDAKAHRSRGVLELKHLHFENGGDSEEIDTIAQALHRFAAFNKCVQVKVTRTSPPALAQPLRAALKRSQP